MKMQMARILALTFCLAGLLVISGCLVDKGDLVDPVSQDFCDSIQVTYDDTIKALIDQSCAFTGCHASGFQSGDFTSYSSMSAYGALDGRMAARVIDENPSSMPPGNPLPDSVKAIFQCWINDGYPQQ